MLQLQLLFVAFRLKCAFYTYFHGIDRRIDVQQMVDVQMNDVNEMAIAMVSINNIVYNSVPDIIYSAKDIDRSMAFYLASCHNLPWLLQKYVDIDAHREWQDLLNEFCRDGPNNWQTSAVKDMVKRLWHLWSWILTCAYQRGQYLPATYLRDSVNIFNDHCYSSGLTCILKLKDDGQVKYKPQGGIKEKLWKRITNTQRQRDLDFANRSNGYWKFMVSRNYYVVRSSDTFGICKDGIVHEFDYDEIDVVCTAKQPMIKLEITDPAPFWSCGESQQDKASESADSNDEKEKTNIRSNKVSDVAFQDLCARSERSSSGTEKKSAFLIKQAPISWLPYTEPMAIIAFVTTMVTIIITSIMALMAIIATVTVIAITAAMAMTDVMIRITSLAVMSNIAIMAIMPIKATIVIICYQEFHGYPRLSLTSPLSCLSARIDSK